MNSHGLPLLLIVAAIFMTPASLARDESQHRLLVLTDISSLTAGVAEPDDGQSLIRLMLYANEFDIEGLIATSNIGVRPVNHTSRPGAAHPGTLWPRQGCR
jgi:hypothetical protein